MKSPTARSLELLEELRYTAQVVEQWIPNTKIRRDLFGCIDILAIHCDYGILGVQATTTSNAATRVKKALAELRIYTWLRAGGQFEVWGWAKRGKTGDRKLWTLNRRKLLISGGLVGVVPVIFERDKPLKNGQTA